MSNNALRQAGQSLSSSPPPGRREIDNASENKAAAHDHRKRGVRPTVASSNPIAGPATGLDPSEQFQSQSQSQFKNYYSDANSKQQLQQIRSTRNQKVTMSTGSGAAAALHPPEVHNEFVSTAQAEFKATPAQHHQVIKKGSRQAVSGQGAAAALKYAGQDRFDGVTTTSSSFSGQRPSVSESDVQTKAAQQFTKKSEQGREARLHRATADRNKPYNIINNVAPGEEKKADPTVSTAHSSFVKYNAKSNVIKKGSRGTNTDSGSNILADGVTKGTSYVTEAQSMSK